MIEALLAERREGAREALALLDARLSERRQRSRLTATVRRQLELLRLRLAWIGGRAGAAHERGSQRDRPAAYRALLRGDRAQAGAVLDRLLVEPRLQTLPRLRTEALLLDALIALDDGHAERASASAALAERLLATHGLRLPSRALARADLERLRRFAPGMDPAAGHPDRAGGRQPLTAAEQRALLAVVEHGTVARAAEASFVSLNTVRSQLKSAYRKLGVHSRGDAIRAAREAGLLEATPEELG